MTAKDFVSCIREQVLERNLTTYRELLAQVPRDSLKDDDWSKVLRAHDSMSADQRKALIQMARIAVVDTISTIFGVLDGSTLLDRHRQEFSLTYGPSTERINGDLQDLFLAAEENGQVL